MTFRCDCGRVEEVEPRDQHEIVSVYHVHPGGAGWGCQSARMEAIADERSAKEAFAVRPAAE